MTAATTYSRESIENVMGMLEHMIINFKIQPEQGVYIKDLSHALQFLEAHIESENINGKHNFILRRKKMTMTEFLKFLQKICAEKTTKPELSAPLFSDELAEIKAYKDIGGYIAVFLEKYAEQKALTKQAEGAFLLAIEQDLRRQFDDPVDLIKHIHKIASRPPFFDSEKVSLAAINAFCGDFMNCHNMVTNKELLQQAPF